MTKSYEEWMNLNITSSSTYRKWMNQPEPAQAVSPAPLYRMPPATSQAVNKWVTSTHTVTVKPETAEPSKSINNFAQRMAEARAKAKAEKAAKEAEEAKGFEPVPPSRRKRTVSDLYKETMGWDD